MRRNKRQIQCSRAAKARWERRPWERRAAKDLLREVVSAKGNANDLAEVICLTLRRRAHGER